jgi:hypothetical protein
VFSTTPFMASNGWLQRFMRDHRYSVQRARTIRRPIVTLQTYNYATWFLHQINHVFATYPPTRIYNADETNIGQLEDYVQVVGRINKPGRRVAMKYDKKTLLTACLTISAKGKVLPPLYIKKGKTARCLQSLGINPAFERGKTTCSVITLFR